jgi:hypothetical protein
MYRPGLLAIRIFIAALAFASCAAIAGAAPAADPDRSSAKPAPALAVEQVRVPLKGLRDEAAMVLVGTALIALAAAVRRAA